MSLSVDTAFVQRFTDELFRLSAQRGSLLRSYVRTRTGVVGKADHWERLASNDLQTITSRHQVWPDLNPTHSRRRCTFTDKGGRIFIDQLDRVKMLIQPDNEYAQNLADAVGRVFDDLIIAAILGTATTVDNADATGSQTLGSAQQIAAGGTGFTFEKVNQAVRILNQGNVVQDGRVCVTSPQGIEDLLAETEVTSSDFSTLNALKTGSLPAGAMWMGCQWVMSTRLALSSTTRSAFMFQRNGMGLSIGKDLAVEIDKNTEHMNATQVAVQVSAGAVRIEEASVVQIDFTEAT